MYRGRDSRACADMLETRRGGTQAAPRHLPIAAEQAAMRASMPSDAWRPMIATMQATAPTRPIIADDHTLSTKENKIARARPIAAVVIILGRTIDLAPAVHLALAIDGPSLARRDTTLGTR